MGGEAPTQGALVLEPEPAPEDARVGPPGINLEKFWSLAEGDPEAILELSTITIHNAEAQKHDFLRALESSDREAFEFQAHKVKMTVDLLQAQGLRDALQVGRRLLTEQESLTARRSAIIRGIQQELDAIISAMKEEVRRVG
jgi:hypothetical protein